MLEINNISKKYQNGVWALKDFSLNITTGVTGLVGPNGAGKTTLMKVISTLLKPTSGSLSWRGHNVVKSPFQIRSDLGYLPQEFGVYPHLTAREFLDYLAATKGLSRTQAKYKIQELLEMVNLRDHQNDTLMTFSGGMKQRIGIAQALLNDPKLLIVDEPTAGLDPEERARFRNLISELSSDRVIILSTHIISDVEATAANLAFICNGKLLTYSPPSAILKRMVGKVREMNIPEKEFPKWKGKHLIITSRLENNQIVCRYIREEQAKDAGTEAVPTLEDAYLYMLQTYSEKNANAHA